MLNDPGFVGTIFTMLLVAFVVLVWPLSRKSAELLQLVIEERRRGDNAKQLADMASALNRIEDHLQQLEERQAFTEALAARAQQPVGIPAANGTQPYPRVGIVEG